ncbi:MAG: adenylyl-sulfate kinase [Parcubacteria group bacterium]|nr:adenylyl-sulfate kinase [Parcubacteria group bacterium]
MGDYLVGGEIGLFDNSRTIFPEHNFFPAETRIIFEKRGWKTITAFQTRNIPHQGHEFLQKKALEQTDGLFIQPVIGEKKLADFKDEYILTSYEILIDKYYPKQKVLLGILPLKMRYAGPREAVFHALIRKNFGCTHFIVGRDHAGVGGYYPPFAAQEIFDTFKKDEIGIEIFKYPEVIFCNEEKKHLFITDCPHKEENKLSFSGTKLREHIKNNELPPEYIIRPEVFNMISQSHNSLVDDVYKNNTKKQGFVLWFTGLSQSGKTTIADGVFKILEKKGLKLERLDGDIVRESLSSDLGFTHKDRQENIKRVAFMSKLLSRNGVGVIASFISPYKEMREKVRQQVANFIEVYTNAPLEVCEARDTKGLYAKARKGEIQNFTGISDPYEAPENPEIELFTNRETLEENIDEVIKYLEQNNLV